MRITSARTVHRSSCGKGSDREMEVIHTSEWVVRNILALIRYKVEGSDKKFKETALIISGRLDLEGQYDKALFIRAQFNDIKTFTSMENDHAENGPTENDHAENGHVRPSKDAYYLGIAKAVAQRATCLRRIYGAVIVNNDEIVSTGYNGAPRGERNCCDTGKCYRRLHQVPHGQMVEKCISVHAEENAIISASRREMQGATLYLWGMDVETGKELPTPEPCLQCWRRIHNAGILRVVTIGGDAHAPQSARRD
nr:MAG TPA: deoxycytidylate deaminase [Bacteriophage sp.]